MRFMIMHKMTAEMEQGLPPDPAIIEGVDKLVAEALKAGAFVSGEGLQPSSQRVHIAYEDGKRTITEGPFDEPKELVGGYALMKVRSREEAISWCDKFAAAVGNVELFMGPVVEPWDLGMMPKPKNPPLRFLSMHRLHEHASSTQPDPDVSAKVGALIDEMTSAGVLQATGGLAGTDTGARVRYDGGKPVVLDGPFTESKELVAGYAILELPSKQAAIDWAIRFGEVVRVNEVEVRRISEA